MAGGFHIPSGLTERKADGAALLNWARNLWEVDPAAPTNRGQVEVGNWLMADPKNRSRLEYVGVDIDELFKHGTPPTSLRSAIEEATGGLVQRAYWDEWTESEAGAPPFSAPSAGDGASGLPPADAPSPLAHWDMPHDRRPIWTGFDPGAEPDFTAGRLGERASGPAFKAMRSMDGQILITSCFGVSLKLDDMSAQALRNELGVALKKRGALNDEPASASGQEDAA